MIRLLPAGASSPQVDESEITIASIIDPGGGTWTPVDHATFDKGSTMPDERRLAMRWPGGDDARTTAHLSHSGPSGPLSDLELMEFSWGCWAPAAYR
ncbi:hypothetical protein [Micromonospora sp. NPDC049301]|uniref:hypothetical protein n=1 Tax=Micromonospora sp. NPDC049301 TaxID=3155723 RepID=UPI003417B745